MEEMIRVIQDFTVGLSDVSPIIFILFLSLNSLHVFRTIQVKTRRFQNFQRVEGKFFLGKIVIRAEFKSDIGQVTNP